MKPTFKEKLNYRFERFLNRGGSSIFLSLSIVFFTIFILIVLIRGALVSLFPSLFYTDNFFQDIWFTFLQMTDPGNMYQDTTSPPGLKVMTILSGFTGVIILSMLIAFITTVLEKTLYEFRKGRGRVIEEGHTLILGWNERVVDIIRELIIANESEKLASVVILAPEDKEVMDDLITKRLPDPKTTRIVTTQGDFANINELHRVNVEGAKSIIILAGASESARKDEKIVSDVQSIKAIMAIISCQEGTNELPIIAEIFTEEKRQLIWYFNDPNIIAINTWEIMGKLLVQTSLTSGLEMVYNEMLSFDGCEIYFHEEDWRGVPFYDLPFYFKDGIPMGIYSEKKGMILRPEKDYKMEKGDQIIILAEDDSTIIFEDTKFMSPNEIELSEKRLDKKKKRILILGWHEVAKIFIDESNDYLLEGSEFEIMFRDPPALLINQIDDLKEEYPGFKMNLRDADPLKLENLEAIKPFEYDNIIILSQELDEHSADKVDSDTLIILLWLRTLNKGGDGPGTNIITQVLNSENQEIITQTDVDDFIISNKLITMILAQLSEEPLIKILYEDLFSEEGSEIYVKPADLYFTSFPQKIRFADAMNVANKRDEICLGIRKGDLSKKPEENFGVKLNLAKDAEITITENDFLVVLSEDEL